MLIRPANLNDLDALEQLAAEAGAGMTTLPANRDSLRDKIQTSLDSFARDIDTPGEELYLFLLEDKTTGRIAGSCAIIAAVGLSRPFYSFRVTKLPHTSAELTQYDPVEALLMVNEYRGSTEIGTLYLRPEYRRDGLGKLLSRSRFLFMAAFAERFGRQVMADMRGVQDENGHSVFWNNLGRRFIPMDFSKADYLSSLGNHQFIADLMPKFPLYIRLLDKAAQDVIGVPHEATRPALELLKREGFRFEGCVDVFDAGPSLHCPLDQIRTVKDSHEAVIGEITAMPAGAEYLIANTKLADFRLCRGPLVRQNGGRVRIDRETATALELGVGDKLRYCCF